MLTRKLIRILLLLCLAVTLCLLAVSCDGTTATPTDTTEGSTTAFDTPAGTEGQVTEAPTEEANTEAPTEAPAPDTSEAEETESVEPSLMTVVDMDVLNEKNVTTYFTRASKCGVSLIDDETEGKVVRLTTKGLTGPAYTQPAVYFTLSSLITAQGGIMPATTEYRYLILKVRGTNLYSHTCSVVAGESLRDLNTAGEQQYARLEMTDEWQYICFDLSFYKRDMSVFYLCYEFVSSENGEILDIAEARLVSTEAEAVELAGTNTYPVTDRTMEDYTLKVVSYNIWAGAIPDWEIRADIFSDFIDTYMPDSVGMQEVSIRWRELLDSVVFNDSYAGVGELRIPGAEYDAIYYRKDKFDLVDTGTFWLSDTPDVMGSTHPDANAERICTWARLRDKQTGFEYVHVNTHLDNNGKNDSSTGRKVRLAQARVILEFIHSLGDVPVVLTGDFNQAHTSSLDNYFPLYKNITGMTSFEASDGTEITVSLADARENAPDSVSPTEWASMVKYHQEGNSAYDPTHKPIDHIFYSPTYFEATVFRNIIHDRDGYHASDHIPQYTELKFKTSFGEN